GAGIAGVGLVERADESLDAGVEGALGRARGSGVFEQLQVDVGLALAAVLDAQIRREPPRRTGAGLRLAGEKGAAARALLGKARRERFRIHAIAVARRQPASLRGDQRALARRALRGVALAEGGGHRGIGGSRKGIATDRLLGGRGGLVAIEGCGG